jgi:high-affinity iron transporter
MCRISIIAMSPIPTTQTEELDLLEPRPALGAWVKGILAAAAACVLAVLAWQGITAHGAPDPVQGQTSAAGRFLDIAVLVFREGLECVLVLSAITANMIGSQRVHQKPVAWGAGIGLLATVATWFIAIGILNNLTESVSALNLQAATGLMAVIVLLIVMNWFFHKMYWGGWICMHTRKKKELIKSSDRGEVGSTKLLLGLGLLGFSSFYREGFEVVLFLQSYRLKLGTNLVLLGTLFGVFLTAIVAILTFIAHRKLPYRKMLVFTGVMLGLVLLVMVGEQGQEMQSAHWIPTTNIGWASNYMPEWMGLWFGMSPTVETIGLQALAAILVIASYFAARRRPTVIPECTLAGSGSCPPACITELHGTACEVSPLNTGSTGSSDSSIARRCS